MRNVCSLCSRSTIGLIALLLSATGTGLPAAAPPPEPASSKLSSTTAAVLSAHERLSLAFTENRGQLDPAVRFYARGTGYGFYLTQDRVSLSFLDRSATDGVTLNLRFHGSNRASTIAAGEPLAGTVNYLRGSDPAGWQTNVARYGAVTYRELWPGIDLEFRADAGALKYEFRVRPGARLADIQLAYEGANGLSLDPSGALQIDTTAGVLRDSAPISYHVVGGVRIPVASRFVIEGTGTRARYGFAIGAGFQPGLELIVDPGIQYSTFLGGSSDDLAAGIAASTRLATSTRWAWHGIQAR